MFMADHSAQNLYAHLISRMPLTRSQFLPGQYGLFLLSEGVNEAQLRPVAEEAGVQPERVDTAFGNGYYFKQRLPKTRRNPDAQKPIDPRAYLAANDEAKVMATLMPEQLWSQAAGAGSEWAMWELQRRGQTVPWVRTNPDSPSDAVEDAEWYLSLPQNTDEYQRLNVYENCCRKHGKTAFNKVLNDAIAAYHERKARRNPGPPMSSRPHNWQAWTYSQQTAWGEGYRDGVHESPNYAWTTSPDYNHYNAGIQQGSMERLKKAGTLGRFGLANPSGPKPGDSVNMVGRLKDSKSDGRYYTGDHVTLVNRHGEFVIAVEQIHRQLGGIQNDTRLIGTLISVKAKNNPSTDDCSRCDGTGYAGPHGDTCSRCEGSGVDAQQRCEGGCGKSVRESQGTCRSCSDREDEENGTVRDVFGYAMTPLGGDRYRTMSGKIVSVRRNPPEHNYKVTGHIGGGRFLSVIVSARSHVEAQEKAKKRIPIVGIPDVVETSTPVGGGAIYEGHVADNPRLVWAPNEQGAYVAQTSDGRKYTARFEGKSKGWTLFAQHPPRKAAPGQRQRSSGSGVHPGLRDLEHAQNLAEKTSKYYRENPRLADFINDGRGIRAKDLTIQGSGPRGGYTQRERALVPTSMFLKPSTRSWPAGDKAHAFIALQYMTRGFGSHAEYPALIQRLAELWPVDENVDVWADYSTKKKKIDKMCGCVMPSVDQLRSR
jgi:hypothetical protein